MLEWTDAELFEFIYAMKGFRRTSSYGVLYKLKKPEREELGEVTWIGHARAGPRGYTVTLSLLKSIPGDNFSGNTGAERWLSLKRSLQLDKLKGADSLGADIPRGAAAAA